FFHRRFTFLTIAGGFEGLRSSRRDASRGIHAVPRTASWTSSRKNLAPGSASVRSCQTITVERRGSRNAAGTFFTGRGRAGPARRADRRAGARQRPPTAETTRTCRLLDPRPPVPAVRADRRAPDRASVRGGRRRPGAGGLRMNETRLRAIPDLHGT